MAEYHLTEEAQEDLADIERYTVDEWGLLQAITYLDQLQQHFEQLARNPLSGREREDYGKGYRSFVSQQHHIFYAIEGDDITILAVVHGSSDPKNYLT